MKSAINLEVEIVLTLTKEEADYLHALTQNCIGSDVEPEDQAKIRQDIFNNTNTNIDPRTL